MIKEKLMRVKVEVNQQKQNISRLKFFRFITRGGSTHAKSYCLVFDYSYCELCCQHNTKKYFKLYQGTESKHLCPIYLCSAGFNHNDQKK